MSNPKNFNDFQKNYCTTLVSEPNSNSFFVKVPVTGYEELSILNMNLLTAIKLIADYSEILDKSQQSQVSHSINSLITILQSFDLHEECDGIDELMK